MASPLRIEAQFTDAASVQQVQRLQAVLETGNTDLVRNALALLDWAVTQSLEGRRVASIEGTGMVVREFTMPLLERARAATHTVLEPEAFRRVASLVERPPKPTPALRTLISDR